MPEQIVIKRSMYIMPPEIISTEYFTNPLVSITNTAASQIVEAITLILLECLNRSP
jgi:hypothetical protein